MTNTLVKDQAFDISITTSYFLSIRISPDGLSFCILDPVVNTYIFFDHYSHESKDVNWSQTLHILESNQYLQLPYKKVFCLIESTDSTLIPTSLFDKEKYESIYDLVHQTSVLPSKLLYHKIRMADAYNLFKVPYKLYANLKAKYTSISFFHQHSPFIESCLISGQNLNKKSIIHISLNENFFDIVVVKSRYLALCNSFKIKSEKDFIYFLLYTFEQLKLCSQETIVTLYGITDRQNTYYLALKKYLRQTQLSKLENGFKYSQEFKKIKIEKYHHLFNLPICV